MMQSYTISLNGGVARNPLVRLAAPASVSFPADEHIAIVGPNGSGKSLLVDMLIGKYPLKEGGHLLMIFLLPHHKQSMTISSILLSVIHTVRRILIIIINNVGILMIMMMCH